MSHGRKPPSPYGANPYRYRQVPKRVRESSGGGCLTAIIVPLGVVAWVVSIVGYVIVSA
jgi:hypothetical protein